MKGDAMKAFSTILLTALMVTAISCSPKSSVRNDTRIVDSLMNELNKAWNSGDPAQVMNLFADDGMMIFPNITVSGRDSLLAFFRASVPNMKNFIASYGQYSVSSDLVTVLGPYAYDWSGRDNQLYSFRGSGNVYWKKSTEGIWKIFLEVDHQAPVVKN